jgi:hypothetical protein
MWGNLVLLHLQAKCHHEANPLAKPLPGNASEKNLHGCEATYKDAQRKIVLQPSTIQQPFPNIS